MSLAAPLDYGAILTGGAAKRMGGRKADIEVGGVPLVELTWRRIAPSCAATYCVGGPQYLPPHLGVPTIPDLFSGADSMGGIATALKYALDRGGENAWVLVVGCDMPFVSPDVIALLASRRDARDVVTPHTGQGFEPLCTLYRAGIYPALEELIRVGNLRIRELFTKIKTEIVVEGELREIDPDLSSFTNVNNRKDLELVGLALRGGVKR